MKTIDPFASAPRVRGNVDLRRQPEVRNRDGSISTVDSRSYKLDGRETLLPTVTADGRHLMSDNEIIAEYLRSGQHLGMFDSPEAATAHAIGLHDAYARGEYKRPISKGGDPSRDMYAPDEDVSFGERMQHARSKMPPSGSRSTRKLKTPTPTTSSHERLSKAIDPFDDTPYGPRKGSR